MIIHTGIVCRFVREMAYDSRFTINEFVVKLNHTSGSYHGNYVKIGAVGVDGILTKISEFTNNSDIFGFYSNVLVIPRIPRNSQVSVVLFDGKSKLQNPIKVGSDRQSPFGRLAKKELLFEFADRVVCDLKRTCPALIADNLMRVDFHGVMHCGKLQFLVNSVEGTNTSHFLFI